MGSSPGDEESLIAENEALRQRVAELEHAHAQATDRVADLSQSLDLLQNMVDNTHSIIYAKDREGHYLLLNRSTAALLGKEPGEIVGKTDADILPPDLAAQFRAGDERVLASGQFLEAEEEFVLGDGHFVYLVQGFPILDEQGTTYAVGGIATDVTRLKQTEQQLRQSEERNRALLNALPDLMFRITRDGVFVDYKAERSDDLAVPAEVFLGHHVEDVLSEELATATMHWIERALETGEVQGYEYDMQVQDETRYFEARYSVCGEHEVTAIIRDITERKRAEAERRTLQEQVIQAQQAAIRELSTPLIPLAPGVVLMPLVGTIDSSRAQMVIETLLEGIAGHQAEVAIVDITGVSVVDTQVANALVQAAQAVRLLGAQVVLTGIGPSMAQTLVHLGADLSNIKTRGSLQSTVVEVVQHGYGPAYRYGYQQENHTRS